MESEYEIKYNLTSNPVPQMSWYVNNVEIPVPGENGRYQTDIRVSGSVLLFKLNYRESSKVSVDSSWIFLDC